MINKYCWECTDLMFGNGDNNALKGKCAEGECEALRCDNCGFILVDHNGLNVRGGYSGESYGKDT